MSSTGSTAAPGAGSGAEEAVRELEAMLDDGVVLELEHETGDDYVLRVSVREGCEDCLVPDDVMGQILRDALERRGVATGRVSVVHDGA